MGITKLSFIPHARNPVLIRNDSSFDSVLSSPNHLVCHLYRCVMAPPESASPPLFHYEKFSRGLIVASPSAPSDA